LLISKLFSKVFPNYFEPTEKLHKTIYDRIPD